MAPTTLVAVNPELRVEIGTKKHVRAEMVDFYNEPLRQGECYGVVQDFAGNETYVNFKNGNKDLFVPPMEKSLEYQELKKEQSEIDGQAKAKDDQPSLDVGVRCAIQKKQKAMKLANLSASTRAKSLIKSSSMEKTVTSNTSLSSNNEKVTLQSNPFEVKSNLPSSGMLVLIFLAFTAGVFSFLSPCTLPILPAYFAVTAQADRARMGFMSVAFFLGLASLFVGMGASASYFGGLLREYMFSLTTIGGIVVVVFGIMTLFGKGFSGASFLGRPASTFIGFFLFGATFALGWTPCVGPILSGILILAASDKTIFQGMALLFFYAVGLGLPLILIATLCGNLPKDGLFWKVLRGKGWDLTLAGHSVSLHSTNIFSGLLLIILGIALTMGYITYINSLIPIEIQIWFSGIEETFLHLFTPKGGGF